jgi:hypothetical protein
VTASFPFLLFPLFPSSDGRPRLFSRDTRADDQAHSLGAQAGADNAGQRGGTRESEAGETYHRGGQRRRCF